MHVIHEVMFFVWPALFSFLSLSRPGKRTLDQGIEELSRNVVLTHHFWSYKIVFTLGTGTKAVLRSDTGYSKNQVPFGGRESRDLARDTGTVPKLILVFFWSLITFLCCFCLLEYHPNRTDPAISIQPAVYHKVCLTKHEITTCWFTVLCKLSP